MSSEELDPDDTISLPATPSPDFLDLRTCAIGSDFAVVTRSGSTYRGYVLDPETSEVVLAGGRSYFKEFTRGHIICGRTNCAQPLVRCGHPLWIKTGPRPADKGHTSLIGRIITDDFSRESTEFRRGVEQFLEEAS